MKVQLKKDHGGSTAGMILKVSATVAAKLISEGLAKALDYKEEKVVIKTKELKTNRKTKTKTVIKVTKPSEDEEQTNERND